MESEKSEILIENMETIVASEEVANTEATAALEVIAVSNVAAEAQTDAASVEVAATNEVAENMETDENPKQPGFGERRQDLYSSERFKVELNNLGKFSYGVSIPSNIIQNSKNLTLPQTLLGITKTAKN